MKATFTLAFICTIAAYSINAESKDAQQEPESARASQPRPQVEKIKTDAPPEAAIIVCVDKEIASQCSFKGPREVENGYCEYTPDKEYFACSPTKANDKKN